MHAGPEHLFQQAQERFARQDYRGAVLLLEEALEAGHAFADVHHLLGLCYSLLGQGESAMPHFDRALALNPRYLEAHVHRGILLSDAGRTAEAEDAFRQAAVSADGPPAAGLPTHIAGRLANQHAELGDAYADAGALDRAIDQYRDALALGPGFADLRYRLARLLLESGRTLEAREELERVVEDQPDFLDAFAVLGLARYLSGDAAGARDVWHTCLERRPGHARVSAYLAMMHRGVE